MALFGCWHIDPVFIASSILSSRSFGSRPHWLVRSLVLSSHGFPSVRLVVPASPDSPRLLPVEASYVPLPVSAIFCTLVRAESLIDKVPVRVPVCVGAKVTLTVQFLPTVSFAGQLLVSE